MLLLFLLTLLPSIFGIWPLPSTLSRGTVTVTLGSKLEVSFIGPQCDFLGDAVQRYQGLIKGSRYFPPVPSNQTSSPSSTVIQSLEIAVVSADCSLGLTTDESYTLQVTLSPPVATIAAKTSFGVLRGLETFSQLVEYKKGEHVIPFCPWSIRDKPLHPHRGLLLDTSRNFFPVEAIKRTLDAMAYNKLNVLHWHVVDSQSFPIEVESLPQFLKAAYSPEMIYSKQDVQTLIRYAYERGIRVIPEFDVPGHTRSWYDAFPEVTVCVDEPQWSLFAAEPPSGQLDPTNNQTYTILQHLLRDMTALFWDDYFHIGGDELNLHCWNSSRAIRAYLDEHHLHLSELVSLFENKVTAYVRDHKKKVVVWEEMVLEHDVIFPPETIVQAWQGQSSVQRLSSMGYDIVVSDYQYWYLDCGHGDWIDGSPSWCDPFKTWERVYSYSFCSNCSGILGGEVALWSEQVDETNLDNVLWPRSSAAAEIMWTGPSSRPLQRLTDFRFLLKSRGIAAEPLQPLWCASHLDFCSP